MYKILVHCEIILEHEIASFYVTKNDDKDFSKLEFDLKIPCMSFRVFKKFRVCTCIHDKRYTIHDIGKLRVYTVTSLV